MAKKTKSSKPQAPAALKTAAAKAAIAAIDNQTCQLRPIPDLPDFEATTGAMVNLFTQDQIGMVLIASATYAGQQLVPDGQAVSKISFKVLANRNTLKLVFVFSASTTGAGELRETCGQGSQFIRGVFGDEPLQIIRIIGR